MNKHRHIRLNLFTRLFLFSAMWLLAESALAQPAGFTDQTFMGGWSQVVGFTWDNNGRMYVWEKGGRVWIVENGVRLPNPLVDISDEVGNWRDFGMLGFALDPNFQANGKFYLYYVVDRHHLMNFGTPSYDPTVDEYFDATIGRVTQYTATAASGYTQTDYNTRNVIVGETPQTGLPILHQSHGTGHIVFGTDGTLMVMMGDGASYSSTDQGSASETYYAQALTDGIITPAENVGAYRCQMLDSHNGKLMRVDPNTGDGIYNNPFYDASNPRSARSRTWALGFRNSYRMDKVPNTGSHNPADADPGVFIYGEVGWANREEMGVVSAPGQNFGWPAFEGMTHQGGYGNPAYAPAVHELPKLDWRNGLPRGYVNGQIVNVGSAQLPGPNFNGNAGTGGVWYNGTDFPAEWQNTYFIADYGGKWIRNVSFDGNYNPTLVRNFLSNIGSVVFVNTHPTEGGLYYVRYPNEIRKVSYGSSGLQAPIAVANADVMSGSSPLTVNFSSTGSFDPDFGQLSYMWNFGNGITSTDANPTHTFNDSNGSQFTVTLTVTDPDGLTDEATIIISLNNTPPQINSTSVDNVNTFDHINGVTLGLTANVTDAESSLGELTFAWQIYLFHNDHNHPEPIDNNQVSSAVLSPIGCDGATYWYRVELTVTDPGGLSTTTYQDIFPDCPGLAQTITFNPLSDHSSFDAPFTISASTSSGLPPVFFVASGPASVIGNTLTLSGTPGTVTVVATQPGNGTYAPALPVFQSFNVTQPAPGNCSSDGYISREVWTGVSGTSVSDIPLGQAANITDQLTTFEIPVNSMDNYGTRIRGYICPPLTGSYTFWISSDDNSQLFLSTNSSPASKQLIASVDAWTSSREWDKFASQQSNPINLIAGQQYYIEVLQKEGTGGDNLAVRWQLPTGLMEEPIPGGRLSGFITGEPLDQTINFPAIANRLSNDPPFQVNAVASSGLPVSYEVISGPATASGNTITLTGQTGTVTVQATQAGNSAYNAAPPVNQSFTVSAPADPQDQTISFTPIADRFTTAPPFQVQATASSGLPVSFEVISGPATVVGNTVTLSGQVGTVVVRATQPGGSGYNAAPPVDESFNVTEPVAEEIDLELTVAASTTELDLYSTVTFTFDIYNLGSFAATNVYVDIQLPDGFAFVTSDAQDGEYNAWLEEWRLINIEAGGNGTMTLDLFVLQETAPIVMFAQVKSADQTDIDSTPDNNAGNTPTEDDEAAITINPPSVDPIDQIISFPVIADRETDDPPFTVTASASSGLPVTLNIISGPATINGNQITLDGVTGTVVVEATQAGNAIYNPATPVSRSFNVTEPSALNQTITFPAISNKLTTDAPFDVSATASSALPVSFEIISGPATIDGTTITLDGVIGTVVVRATQAGNAQYNPATPVDRSFNVSDPNGGGPGLDLELSGSVSPQVINIWSTNVFTFTLTNNGTETGNNITVDMPIPDGYAYAGSNSPGSNSNYNLFISQWEVGPLAPGESVAMTLDLFALQNTNPVTVFAQVIAASPDDVDSTPNNNSTTVPSEDDEVAVTAIIDNGGGPVDQTISVTPTPDQLIAAAPFQVTATATSNLPVAIEVQSGPATIDGNTVTLDGTEGTVILRFSQAGNQFYNPAQDVFDQFNVTAPTGPPTIAIVAPLEGSTIVGNTVQVNYQTAGNLTGIHSAILTLDSDPEIDIHDLTGSYTLNNVAPGAHTITLALVDDNHVPLPNSEATSVVNFSTVVDNGGGDPPTGYCAASGDEPWWQWIDNVSFVDINNTSFKEGYGDFTDESTGVVVGNTYPISLNPGFSWLEYDEYWRVWIDFNRDGNFDANEVVLEDHGTGAVTGTVNIPADAAVGSTRMRVAMQNGAYADPCGSFQFGEVEDYTVNIIGGGTQASFIPGETTTDYLSFVAAERENGIQLLWTTNSDYKNRYFMVEWSDNGNFFEDVQEVASISSSYGVEQYTTIIPKPEKGAHFYRIRQVYNNGNYKQSEVRFLSFNSEDLGELKLFPNPAQDELYMNLAQYAGAKATVELVNAAGQVIINQKVDAIPTTLMNLDLSAFQDGLYLLNLKIDGQGVITKKVVIKR